MLRPSISQITTKNENSYSVVIGVAKRARQIIGGKKALVNVKGAKPLSIAVEELNQGKIQILTEEEANALSTDTEEEQ